MKSNLRRVIALLVAWGSAIFCFAQNGPDLDPDAAPGYVDNVFHHGSVDSVNLYNGNLTVPVAIGPSYPVGPNLKLQLLLTYNSRTNEYGRPQTQLPDFTYVPLAGDPALGIGWTFTLGAIKDCKVGNISGRCYISPDGASHFFGGTAGPNQTTDGTQFYLTGSGPFQMWDGDGNRYTFGHQVIGYDDPSTNYIHDFGDGRDGWYLTSVVDPFNNQYSISYHGTGTAPCWSYPANGCTNPNANMRMSCPGGLASWIPQTITYPSGSITVLQSGGRITGFQLPVVIGGSPVARTWTVEYQTENLNLPCPGASRTVSLEKISAIRMPTDLPGVPFWQFTYGEACNPKGYLTTLRVPTGATVSYTYGVWNFFHGRVGALEPGCGPRRPPSLVDVEVSGAAACGGSLPTSVKAPGGCADSNSSRWLDSVVGVIRREEKVKRDPADPEPTFGNETVYTQYAFPYGETNSSPGPTNRPQTLTVVLHPPDIDGKRRSTATFFHAAPWTDFGSAQPGDRIGADIEERIFDGDANPAVGPIPQPACGPTASPTLSFCVDRAVRVSKRLYEYDVPSAEIGNRRLISETRHLSPSQPDGSCSGCLSHTVAFSNFSGRTWNGNGRHFNIEDHSGSLGNDSRRIETTWDARTSPLWLPNLYTLKVEQASGATGLTRTEKRYEFDSSTGFLKGVSNWEAGRSLAYLNCRYPEADGDLGQEFAARFLGVTSAPPVDQCTQAFSSMPSSVGENDDNWGKAYSYQNGLRASATWINGGIPLAAWQILRHSRDPGTGWVLSTTRLSAAGDVTGAETTAYQYDSIGRVTSITPPGEAPVAVSYPSPNSTTVLRNAGTGPLGTRHEYFYDGLGRLIRERRLMPGGIFSKRFFRFDPAGNEYFSSEWVADGTSETVSATVSTSCAFSSGGFSTFRPLSAPGTYRHCYDPLDRPQSIVGPMHSSLSTVSRSHLTAFYSDTLERTTTACINGTFSSGICQGGTPSETVAQRDAFARVTWLTEPGLDQTAYFYDVNSNLTHVFQGVQQRVFSYDAAGFLRSENTPEKGVTTYDDVGASGNVIQETQGDGAVITRTYDFAGRLQEVQAGGVLYGQHFYDGTGFPGGTRPKGKLTRRVGYNPMSPSQPIVTEDFSYSGIGARLSQKTVTVGGTAVGSVTQDWTYNGLGLLASYSLPRRGGEAATQATVGYTSGYPTSLSVAGGPAIVSSASYHLHGGISALTAPNGVTTTITTDSSLLPRPAAIQSSTGGFSTGTYSYDGAGNIRAMGSDTFTYDLRSRLDASTVSGVFLDYVYDRYGNLNPSAVNPANNRLSLGAYDGRGNLRSLGAERWDVDLLSRLVAYKAGRERYLYDGAGERVAKLTYSASGGANFFTLTPCRVVDTRDPVGPYGGPALPGSGGRVFKMTGRCQIPGEAVALSGNLTVTGPTAAGTFLLFPQWTSPTGGALSFSAGQTRANNFNVGLSGNGEVGLLFASSAGAQAHAILDVNGYYAYPAPVWSLTYRDEANRLSSEYRVSAGGAVTRERNYFYFGNLLVGTRESSGAYRYYASDHLGTPRLVTNASGGVVASPKYQPFGTEIGASGDPQPLKFAQMERDSTSVRDFVHARYLGTSEGRFLSPDKVQGFPEDPQSWNRYTYAGNNPLRYIDPDGNVKFESPGAQVAYATAAQYLSSSATAYASMRELNALTGAQEPTLVLTSDAYNQYVPETNTIYWNPSVGLDVSAPGQRGKPGVDGSLVQTPALGLLHEASHAIRNNKDPAGFRRDVANTKDQGPYTNAEERRVVRGIETKGARELGEPTRRSHKPGARLVPKEQPASPARRSSHACRQDPTRCRDARWSRPPS